MKEQKKDSIAIWKGRIKLAAVVLAILVGTFTLGAVWSRTRTSAQPTITSDLLSQQLGAISELATVEYRYTNMGKFENQVDFYGWKVPLTRKSFIVSYDGMIKAGIDAKEIAVTVRGNHITLKLPEPVILSHEIEEDSLEILDETSFIFNPLQISDYTGFSVDQKVKLEARAVENGLLAEAGEKARAAVAELLALAPGMEQYELEIA